MSDIKVKDNKNILITYDPKKQIFIDLSYDASLLPVEGLKNLLRDIIDQLDSYKITDKNIRKVLVDTTINKAPVGAKSEIVTSDQPKPKNFAIKLSTQSLAGSLQQNLAKSLTL